MFHLCSSHDASAVVCDLRDVFRQREPFWLIKLEYGPARTTFHWARERLFDQEVCRILFEIVQAQEQARVIEAREQYVKSCMVACRTLWSHDHPAAVCCVVRPTSRQRPVPLATVELQRRASRYFHMPGEVTMKVAEELYVKGYISYPR